jgi:hypothetical protein
MYHRLNFKGKLHGWHLRNVKVDCGAILAQASPVEVDKVKRSAHDDLCWFCVPVVQGAAQVLRESGVVYLEDRPAVS